MSDPTTSATVAAAPSAPSVKNRDWFHVALLLIVAPALGLFMLVALRLGFEVAGLVWSPAAAQLGAVFALLMVILVWLKLIQDSKTGS